VELELTIPASAGLQPHAFEARSLGSTLTAPCYELTTLSNRLLASIALLKALLMIYVLNWKNAIRILYRAMFR
jgi:hypothetical protein